MSEDGPAPVFTNTKNCNTQKLQLFLNIFSYKMLFLHNMFAYMNLVNIKSTSTKLPFFLTPENREYYPSNDYMLKIDLKD